MSYDAVMRNPPDVITRSPRILAWMLVLFVCDLLFVPITSNMGTYQPTVIGLFAGPLLGQCVVVALLGGLYGKTWIDGFRTTGFAVLIGFGLFLCGIMLEQGSLGDGFWPAFFAIPGAMFAVLAPLLLMRHFGNWRLVDPLRTYAKQPADLGSMFISIAALALIVAALRVPQLVFKVPSPSFWLTCSSIGIVTMLVSSAVTIPLAVFVLNNPRAKSRLVALVVCGFIAFGVFFICMTVVGFATGESMPGDFLLCAAVATASATLVVYAGIWAIRNDGFRLRTASNALATQTMLQSDEQKSLATLSLAQHRKWTILQLIACFAIMAALNGYVSVQHSAEAQYARGIKKVREVVTERGGSIQEYDDQEFGIDWQGSQTDANFFMSMYQTINTNPIRDKLVAIDFTGVRGNLFLYNLQNYAPNLKSLDVSSTSLDGRELAVLIQRLPLEHLVAKGLILEQTDWSGLPDSLNSLVLNGSKFDVNRLTRNLAKWQLERLELNDVAKASSVVETLALMPTVERLGLAGADVTDVDIEELQDHEFAELNLSRTRVTDACVDSLLQCMRKVALELELAGTGLTDTGVSRLNSIRIGRLLDLSETDVTGEAFRDWKHFPSLLKLSKTKVGDELVETLLEAPAVERIHEEIGMKLDLSHTPITDAVLIPLNKRLVGAFSVDVSRTKITAAGLAKLARPPNKPGVGWYVETGKFSEQELNSLRASGISVTEK